MAAGVALAGLAVGILFLAVLGMVPRSPLFVIGDYHQLPDEDDCTPLAQFRIDDLKDAYKAGERIDFSVAFIGIGCQWPESIAVVNSGSGAVVWDFNGTTEGPVLFCPIVTNPSEFEMTWKLSENTGKLVIDQPGRYAVIVNNEHITIQKSFEVE